MDPGLARFVDAHVRTLLAWEISSSSRSTRRPCWTRGHSRREWARRPDDLDDDLEQLCRSDILSNAGGLIRYKPSAEIVRSVDRFADACTDKRMRLALVAAVLEKIDRTFRIES